jgi:hypothetical protein
LEQLLHDLLLIQAIQGIISRYFFLPVSSFFYNFIFRLFLPVSQIDFGPIKSTKLY